ncbi:MAG TPA: ribosome maturation factor RimM [Rhodanobacteraceae bacterium]|nr:ribosome maturation factor RimM [Rhodanobacteraceae bacterium]
MAGPRVEVGRIVGLHGLRGAVKLESWTDPRVMIFQYRPWTLVWPDGTEREFAGARGQVQGKGLTAELPGVDGREQAQTVVGSRVFVPRSALPPAGDGEYYWADLEGLAVVNLEGVAFGRVSHLVATGANDVLVVRDDDGRERLLPFVIGHCVQAVDLDAARITVDWDPDF